MKLKQILVPTDFSEGSRFAFAEAFAVAKQCGAELILVHVVANLPAYGLETGFAGGTLVETYEDRMRQTAADEIAKLVAEIGDPAVKITTDIRYGGPAMQITESITEHRPDLVVLSTHGRSGLTRAVVGSVAEPVIRHSDVPILALRPSVDLHPSRAQHILLTTDGSEEASAAAPWAKRWSDMTHASIAALWVVEDPVSIPLMDWQLFPEVRQDTVYHELEELARHRAKEALGPHLGDLPDCRVRHGSPVVEIAAEASTGEHDLLIMATHGRSGFRRLFLGSVTERALRDTAIPMLIVPIGE